MTGSHTGVGLVGARTLTRRFRCNLILAGGNPERVEAAAQQLRTETGVEVEVLEMDLNSITSARAGVAQCKTMLQAGKSHEGEIESIVCNAGAPFRTPISYSADGYEKRSRATAWGIFY